MKFRVRQTLSRVFALGSLWQQLISLNHYGVASSYPPQNKKTTVRYVWGKTQKISLKVLGHHEQNLNCMNFHNRIKHRGSRAPAPTHPSASLTWTFTSRTGLHNEPGFWGCTVLIGQFLLFRRNFIGEWLCRSKSNHFWARITLELPVPNPQQQICKV